MSETLKAIALIEALKGSGGGGGSSLPAVTSSDNGKVLGVVDGAWEADSNLFVVTASGTPVTINKTVNEITAALDAGMTVLLVNETYSRTFTYAGQDSEYLYFINISKTQNYLSYIAKESGTYTIVSNPPMPASPVSKGCMIISSAAGTWKVKKKEFIVTLTPTSPDFSGTMDKTVAEINAAYEAGQEIVFRVYSAAGTYNEVDCAIRYKNGDYTYPSFNAYIVNPTDNVFIFAYTKATDDGTKQTYSTAIFTLTPAS